MKLAVIGGGDLQDSNHLPINERLIELTNKQYPKVLFIPTASHDDESYIKLFLDTFENNYIVKYKFYALQQIHLLSMK